MTSTTCSPSSSGDDPLRGSPLEYPQPGVERVAEAIAQEVEAQAGQGEGEAREQAYPEGFADDVLAARDDVAPRRHVGRNAHPEEAEDRLRQHGVGKDERPLDEQGRHAVGQDVAPREAEVGSAQRSRRLYVVQ